MKKTSHGAQFGAYCGKQLQGAREGWTGCGERGVGGGGVQHLVVQGRVGFGPKI